MLYGPKLLVDGKNHNVMSNYNVSQTSYQFIFLPSGKYTAKSSKTMVNFVYLPK